MSKKSKGETIELLYSTKKELNKKVKNKPKKIAKKESSKRNNSIKNTKIDLNNEIVIGLTPKKNEDNKINKKKKKTNTKVKTGNKIKKSKKNKKENRVSKTKQVPSKYKIKKNKDGKQTQKRRNFKIIKWTTFAILIITSIILFMMSSVFNIKQIVVLNNSKISSEEIISLSKLTTGVNMFKISKKSIKNKIKTNPYIEYVNIKRSISGTLTLEIKERIPTYMLKFANAYVYINNQGYMLEITETPLELPTITGFKTPTESIVEGKRLVIEDLKKLEDVIKIMETAKSNSLANIITSIDISDSTNYILTIQSEAKTVQFGDTTNANIKVLKIESLIEQEKGVEGEIYFQNSEKTVFREKVNF